MRNPGLNIIWQFIVYLFNVAAACIGGRRQTTNLLGNFVIPCTSKQPTSFWRTMLLQLSQHLHLTYHNITHDDFPSLKLVAYINIASFYDLLMRVGVKSSPIDIFNDQLMASRWDLGLLTLCPICNFSHLHDEIIIERWISSYVKVSKEIRKSIFTTYFGWLHGVEWWSTLLWLHICQNVYCQNCHN